MISDHPDDGDFWIAFASEADVIEDMAGPRLQTVCERIFTMLAARGRAIAIVSCDKY